MVRSVLVVRTDIMGQGGGRERGVNEIRGGVAMIGHGGGRERVVSCLGQGIFVVAVLM